MSVAVQDGAVARDCQRALVHALDQRAIGLLSAAQGKNLRPLGPAHDERIDGAMIDGAQGFFGFRQPCSQNLELGLALVLHHPHPAIPRPASTRRASDMSPISLFGGSGNILMRVGAATSWCAVASSGCW